jgi:hypothetical protein
MVVAIIPSQNQPALHNPEMASHRRRKISGGRRIESDKRHSKKKSRVPIDELFEYWVDLSRRATLTQEDFRTFLRMSDETFDYFVEHFGWYRNKHVETQNDRFYVHVNGLVCWQDDILKKVLEQKELGDREYIVMKEYAKKFITRIKKIFGRQLALSQVEKTPIQDAEHLNSSSTKLTYRWAAGIIASNHIATLLIRLSNFQKGEKIKDDIDTLYAKLKNSTKDPKLKRFLTRSYRRFEDADKTRNRCAHVDEGEPTRQEIDQSISLARLLQRFVSAKKKTPPGRGKVIARTSGVTGGPRERP